MPVYRVDHCPALNPGPACRPVAAWQAKPPPAGYRGGVLTPEEVAEMRHKAMHGQRPIVGEAITLSFVGGPLDGLHIPVDAHSAGHPFIGFATVTRSGCVVAEYTGDGAETVRTFAGYKRPAGEARPGHMGREA